MSDFILLFDTEVTELNSRARLWRHGRSGAQLLSLSNKDENKVFGVSFRTPPHDSTGLPHILEHSVLCGSDKYPVKEPFVELLKGSLQTFLNAFTYPDKTCYPVASANLQDFYNLVDVYLDAVFHPRITEAVFQQEGWHLDAEAAEDGRSEITFKGVVYNEMKGVFSSPEAVLERESMHALFPDTPYGLESGGDPEAIPSLTFADFIAFHRRYYHPSNARFYFWGDDPEEKRLEIVGQALAGYEASETESSRVPLQLPFAAPKRLRLPFAAGQDDKPMFTLNWVMPGLGLGAEDTELVLAMEMLEHILLGMPASPLRRALIESGLGEDLAGSGMQVELRQLLFSIGLKGLNLADGQSAEQAAARVEELILATLRDLADNGVPLASLEAAVNSVEFSLRENNTGHFPVGLSVMLRSLTTWLYSDDFGDEAGQAAALSPLRFEEPLSAIKRKALGGQPGYFEGIIKKYFLDNRHQAAVLLQPDPDLARAQARREEERLKAKLSGLSEREKSALVEGTARLRAMQEAPDAPEDLARIPRLQMGDLPRSGQEIRQKTPDGSLPPLYYHDQPTSGICYLDAHLDISPVPDRLLPLVPLLGRAMLEMGNSRRDYIELNMEIARKTGGMDSDLTLFTRLRDRMPVGALTVSGKAAPDKVGDLFDLLAELLSETALDNPEHFGRMLLEEKARLEYGLVPSGHLIAAGRLRASNSLTGWLSELCSGLSYLESVRALCDECRSNWPGVLKKLQDLRKIIVNRQGLVLNITAEGRQEAELRALAARLAERLPEAVLAPVCRAMEDLPAREAIVVPAQVNFMAKGMNLFDQGYVYHGSALAILKYLRTGFLWEKVRVQGGAYGAFATLDRFTGDFVLASYRDPNIAGTLQIFDGCAAHLMDNPPDRRALEASIIGAIGELDSYLLPEAKGKVAFGRALTGSTPEIRAQVRDEVFSATAEHFRLFGQALAGALPGAGAVGLGGQDLEDWAGAQGWTVNKAL
ncbi:MAG: insulinase family protein [Deltaproteobacteria bacterium]|nr:insulinase family protein [Deltaproteobacteria bacterium]